MRVCAGLSSCATARKQAEKDRKEEEEKMCTQNFNCLCSGHLADNSAPRLLPFISDEQFLFNRPVTTK